LCFPWANSISPGDLLALSERHYAGLDILYI